MNGRAGVFTIGQLARRTGLSVRTIRFWSDAGLVPPTDRTDGGYRVYDAEGLARIELVRTLRELGLGIEAVRAILERQTTLGQVARAHAEAIDAEIRALRLRRAVLRTIARRNSTSEEMTRMHELAKLSARERQRIVDDFVDRTFAGVDPQAPGAGIAGAMRQLPAELPDDPTDEQVDAWVELAKLVQDAGFQEKVRAMAMRGAAPQDASLDVPLDAALVGDLAGRALADGVAPESAAGKEVLDRIVPPGTAPERRRRLRETLETFTDARVERYWQLMGVLNGRPAFQPTVPPFEWLIAALRAHG